MHTSPEFTLRADANDTSIALDMLRAVAAQMVCVGHALSFFEVANVWRPPHAPYMQNLGVIIFFVLSGFLIAHALQRSSARPAFGLQHFLIDRFARIYSAFVPAMIVIAAIEATLMILDLHPLAQYISFKTFFGTLAMLNNYAPAWGGSLGIVSFGSAGHLWSLAVEFHFYLFAGGVFFALKKNPYRRLGALLALLTFSVPWQYFKIHILHAPGSGLSWLWLAGFGLYYLVHTHRLAARIPAAALYLCALALATLWWLTAPPKAEYALRGYVLLTAAFLLLLLASQKTKILLHQGKGVRFIQFVAHYSFSLYLIHYTLLFVLHQLWPQGGWSAALLGILVSNVAAIVLASVGESHYRSLARWIKQRFGILPAEKSTSSTPTNPMTSSL